MSNGEKKNNLADLLEEYFPGAGKKAERILNEVFAEYEPEKQEISEEIIDGEGLEEFEDAPDVPEEPFEVPDETEDAEDASETPEDFSTLSRWSDWADETIAANAVKSEAFGAAETEAENTVAAETDDTDAEESLQETEETEPEQETGGEEVSKEETEAVTSRELEDSTEKEEITESEDINEIWIKRFSKRIFPVKGDSVFEVIRKIIFLAAVVVFIGAGIMLASTLIQSRKAVEVQSEARSLIETTVATTIDEDGNVVTIPPTKEEQEQHNKEVAKSFKEINEDYIGYLEVSGCDIYEPVVKGEDNAYYLKNNIYGEQNKAGTIFMDYRCTVTPEYTSPNIVIYGHNQEDGTMFGHLKYYKVDYSRADPNANFYKHNPVIKFNPEFENSEYLIYAFFVTNALENQDSHGEVFHYHDYIETMKDESTFNWYQDEVQKRNQIISPVDVVYGDQLLVLSTCSNEFTNSRFVVFARKLRDGESASDYDFSETRLNPNPKGVDWEAIMSGETSATTVPIEETEEILDESTTRRKSINKRNEKTYTKASEEEPETTSEVALPVDATVTAVPVSETSDTETETAGSTESTESTDSSETDESGTETDENGTPAVQTDENGETVTYSDSETSESSDTETTSRKKRTETSETSEAVTSKKKSKKSNK